MIALALGCLALGMVAGIAYRKRIAEAAIGSAEERAFKIVEDAKKDAEARKKEILLEAKEESIKTKNELEKEINASPDNNFDEHKTPFGDWFNEKHG